MQKTCVDCEGGFETTVIGLNSPVRCIDCRHRFRLANHGGGPRRRCKKYDIPYEPINPLTVFERDDWICGLCSEVIDRSLLGAPHNPMAPEMDHEWPLSVRINGLKSPGHILSNVGASHRICNGKKKEKVSKEQAKFLVRKFYPEAKVVRFSPSKPDRNPKRQLICQVCQKPYVGKSLRRKTCSLKCYRVHHNFRVRRGVNLIEVPKRGNCPHCRADFKPKVYNQKYCSVSHSEYARRKRQRIKQNEVVHRSCKRCNIQISGRINKKFCTKACRKSYKTTEYNRRKSLEKFLKTIAWG